MTEYNPNRPTGSGMAPERGGSLPGDRHIGETPPPEYRGGPPRGDGGNSAMALIVGALAVALIIGAFFWFAGDTQDTAILDEPATIQQDTVPETAAPQTQQPAIATDEDTTGTDEDTMDTTGTDQDTTGTTSN
jgi:uncharacterized protein HemX